MEDRDWAIKYPFDKEYYITDENHKRFIGDILSFGSRLFFYYRILKLIYMTNKAVKNGKFCDEVWCDSSYYALKSVEGCGGRFFIYGLNNIDVVSGPVIFVGNHMSVLETFILPVLICSKRKVTFVVKKSLIDYPFFGLVMRSVNPVVVGRDNPAEDFKVVMNDGIARIKDGYSIIVFPQSTRSVEFDPEKFNTIGIKLAKRAKVPVIPIAIKSDFWGNGKFLKDFGPIRRNSKVFFEFGSPIYIEGNGKKEHHQIIEFIQDRLKKWNFIS